MNKKDKVKTHSTQRKYFGTIPRSEFYGFVLGYAVGLFISGALHLESQYQQIVCAVIGLAIGYYIDKKYFQEPDEPVSQGDGSADSSDMSQGEGSADSSDMSQGDGFTDSSDVDEAAKAGVSTAEASDRENVSDL